jgi:hypothetical protein
MKGLGSARIALIICVSAALLGCGLPFDSAQGKPAQDDTPAVGALGPMLQSDAVATHAERRGSWMLPEAKTDDLLYVGNQYGNVYAFSYPRGKLVGELESIDAFTGGLCADRNGDVFVTSENDNSKGLTAYVYEFAHGGANPIAMLKDSYGASSCAVDPTTGNLAVTGFVSGYIAIYPEAQDNPTYVDDYTIVPAWCAYDNRGDLFVDGQTGDSNNAPYALTELPPGGTSFKTIQLNESIGMLALQWNNAHLVASFRKSIYDTTLNMYRIKISGTSGEVAGTTVLNVQKKPDYRGQFLILGNSVLAADDSPHPSLQLWHYPAGGDAVKTLIRHQHLVPYGVVLSKAPTSK